ncbi:MAG: hypothetical protein V4451_17045 [Pseudomonadota bacterium]
MNDENPHLSPHQKLILAQVKRALADAESGNISAAMFRCEMADGTVKFISGGFEGERPEAIQSMKDALEDLANGVERPPGALS